MKEIIEVPGIPAIGPYSQAVRVGGLLFVSGQPGIDPVTGQSGATFSEQARQAFSNLGVVLHAGGSSFAQVVNTTVLIADVSEFAVVNELFAEHFGGAPPARMTMTVPLPKGLLFSIGCVASLD
jgi:2-iminobutanoate/2-iminopropanoate deaminase